MALVLASSSPRRRELLARVGIAFEVLPASVDESPRPGEPAADYARRLAAVKAGAVRAARPDCWVLAADTVVEIGGDILGKPADAAEAAAMLARLCGRVHRVITAFALVPPLPAGAPPSPRAVTTSVAMRAAGADEIADYVAAGEWRDKAGAYAVQGMAAGLVSEIQGSITNVVGLPLAEVIQALAAAGVAPRYTEGQPA